MNAVKNLIILDRDGVINCELGDYVTTPHDFVFADGALEAIARLSQAGYQLGIATNQAGIAKGLYDHTQLAGIHAQMLLTIRRAGGDIGRILYCSSYDHGHPWRKPNPGMLLAFLADLCPDYPPHSVYFVGDHLRDMQAAEQASCHGVWIGSDNQQQQDYRQFTHAKSLLAWADSLLDGAP